MTAGDRIMVKDQIRVLFRRVNTGGDWELSAPVDGTLYWHQTHLKPIREEKAPMQKHAKGRNQHENNPAGECRQHDTPGLATSRLNKSMQ